MSTPLKFNIEPPKLVVWVDVFSFSTRVFSGSILLVFAGYCLVFFLSDGNCWNIRPSAIFYTDSQMLNGKCMVYLPTPTPKDAIASLVGKGVGLTASKNP